jgi:DNA-binding CsgD family transcriptional regulator
MKIKRNYVFFIYFISLLLVAFDMCQDALESESLSHILIEGSSMLLFSTLAMLMIIFLLKKGDHLSADLDCAREDLLSWKRKTNVFTEGLGQEIESQFSRWSLTCSEKEVAILLIKGLPIKQICELRFTSEKTVRAQLSSVYKKAQVKGRVELCAFFLEDLILPYDNIAMN